MFKHSLSKYQSIVAAVALFLVVDMGVLVMNFIIASQIQADAASVNLAGRQRMLSQRMAKVLYQMEESARTGQPINERMEELKLSFALFDTTLTAFRRGGTVKGGGGEQLYLAAVADGPGQIILKTADAVWAPYRALVQATLTDADPAKLQAAVAAASASNLKLLNLMNDLTTHVERAAAGKAQTLRLVQAGGMVLAILNFFLILFHFMKQLRRSDQAREEAKQETDQILTTVNEGLFLLDRDLHIGTQYSKELERLFRCENLAHRDFIALLGTHVSERTMQLVKDYVGLLLEHRVNQHLITDLNPLNRVEMNFQDQSGGLVTKYLDFRFRRVLEAGVLSHILVTVSDTTERVHLQQDLAQANERAEQQVKMVSELLLLDPFDLPDMIQRTRTALLEVNDILRHPAHDNRAFVDKLNYIYRVMHRIKGDAGAVGLSLIESHAHRIEDSLAELQQRPTLTGNDFILTTVQIERLLSLIDNVEEMLNRLTHLRGAATPRQTSLIEIEDLSLERRLKTLAQRAANRGGKSVQLTMRGLEDAAIPEPYRHAIQELAQQFVRNAVAHGIETPDRRAGKNKPGMGLVNIAWTQRQEGGFALIVEDDGAGISLDAIRERLAASGMPAAEVENLNTQQLLKQLFRAGFSTRSNADEDAGRGVGLDAVHAITQRLGGHIRLHSRLGELTRFHVLLPDVKPTVEYATQ